MKANSFSIVYNGSDPDTVFAAAVTDDLPVLAAADGNKEQAAVNVIRMIGEAASGQSRFTAADLESCLSGAEPVLNEMHAEVSLAGMIFDGPDARVFNIGSARVLRFSAGSVKMHTDDHTEAYEKDFDRDRNAPKEYDELRIRDGSRVLTRALGRPESSGLQFYPSVELQKDDAFIICTESFWRYLNPIEMELDYRKAAGPEEWLRIMTRRVLMKGGKRLDQEYFAAAAVMIE